MAADEFSTNRTDQELVVLTLKQKEYYKYLVERYEGKLLRYIIRLSGVRREDAKDVLQEVFIKTYQNLNDFDDRLKFSSWIYRIAHNETITYLRKVKARPKIIDSENAAALMDSIKADLNVEEEMDKKYLAENVEKIIDGLDEKYKTVVVLKYMEGKDYQEMSDILKKPTGTIATLLKRAKDKIKREISGHKIYFK
jgi:RNA polymerase sigma-70 factor (ECF subfamily)